MNVLMLLYRMNTLLLLPSGLLPAICQVESGLNVSAVNENDGGTASVGVCQIKFKTAVFMGYTGDEKTLRKSTHLNAFYAAKYIRYNIERYPSNFLCAVAAYNAGRCNVTRAGHIKNARYVAKVMEAWKKYDKNQYSR